ncbi:MAG: hypothetical protein RL104_573 [Bacteroidota bacterium]
MRRFGADVKHNPLLPMKIIRTTHSRLSQVDFANLGFGSGLADHAFYAEFADGSWDEGRVEPYGPLKQGLALPAELPSFARWTTPSASTAAESA